jgi:hypothetical protein
MTQYVLAYVGRGQPATPEEGAEMKKKWGEWMRGLGAAIVNPGMPLGATKTVGADGVRDGGSSQLTGFTIVEAESMDAALAMAKDCPFLKYGVLEVSQAMQMQ